MPSSYGGVAVAGFRRLVHRAEIRLGLPGYLHALGAGIDRPNGVISPELFHQPIGGSYYTTSGFDRASIWILSGRKWTAIRTLFPLVHWCRAQAKWAPRREGQTATSISLLSSLR